MSNERPEGLPEKYVALAIDAYRLAMTTVLSSASLAVVKAHPTLPDEGSKQVQQLEDAETAILAYAAILADEQREKLEVWQDQIAEAIFDKVWEEIRVESIQRYQRMRHNDQ